ncbi:hypothetical protein B0T21DRAFT_397073 [Apiosordaria backusii]|uniref:Uncharacterized protein n=1 Tax=Apiosordaria backusii TaxID=314023 RepID=A0AA39ZYB3_9PEZI|nr:hypothetical protein B0T21DRAFT_397073 [Apiosordaria backusii]
MQHENSTGRQESWDPHDYQRKAPAKAGQKNHHALSGRGIILPFIFVLPLFSAGTGKGTIHPFSTCHLLTTASTPPTPCPCVLLYDSNDSTDEDNVMRYRLIATRRLVGRGSRPNSVIHS